MGIWEAMELLNTLVDASDPDTDATQIEHLLQTAQAMRMDGKPEWMQVTGLIHDLGKLLYFFDSDGQWVSRQSESQSHSPPQSQSQSPPQSTSLLWVYADYRMF